MLLLFFQLLAGMVLGALNLYGTSRIYAAERLPQKAGLLAGWAALVLLVHLFQVLVRPQWPPVLVFSLFLLASAALSSAVLRGHGTLFHGFHRHQRAAHPVAWPAMVQPVDWFCSRLTPVLITLFQAWRILA